METLYDQLRKIEREPIIGMPDTLEVENIIAHWQKTNSVVQMRNTNLITYHELALGFLDNTLRANEQTDLQAVLGDVESAGELMYDQGVMALLGGVGMGTVAYAKPSWTRRQIILPLLGVGGVIGWSIGDNVHSHIVDKNREAYLDRAKSLDRVTQLVYSR